ncbi:MAG: hypothetical protein CMQ45_02720 [Gammaproteobacteria bacterium]|nr:hypothetical protein [Gammaproteobacteria bacterium]
MKTLYAVSAICASVATGQQNNVLPDYPNAYEIVRNVVDLPEGRRMGSGNAIDIDSSGNVWVFERCGGNNGACIESDVDPVLQFSPEGKLLSSFGSGMFVWPHGIVVDGDDNLWLIDAGVVDGEKGNQIFKFSQEGTLLLELGEPGVRGDGPGQFNEPSDLAIGPDGTLYIIDGHINPDSNRRVVHMTAEGDFIESWGSKGFGPLQFEGPHAIAVDSSGRMYIGDRTNNRLQVLSPTGELLAIWTHWGRPSGIRIVGDTLYAVDSESRAAFGEYGYNPGWHRGIYVGRIDGTITDFIPDPTPSGPTSFPEGIGVSDDGVIWGASVGDREILKFIKR